MLQEPRLLFQLTRQHFVELLRIGTPESRLQAIRALHPPFEKYAESDTEGSRSSPT